MSFDRSFLNPNHETHVPIKVEVPSETAWSSDRGFIQPPTLWQHGTKVVHKLSGREALVRVVDLGTMMFRAHYPDTGEDDSRTTWQHCREWTPATTLSPAEQARQEAAKKLEEEIAHLDAKELAAVQVLVDDPDPARSLAKLEALRTMGVVRARPEAVVAATEEKKTGKKVP